METLILGATMIMDNVEEEVMVQVIWLSFLVQDLLILIAILDQIFSKLNADQSILHLWMKLEDFLLVEEDKTDNLDMGHLLMSLLLCTLAKFPIKLIRFHAERLIQLYLLLKEKYT